MPTNLDIEQSDQLIPYLRAEGWIGIDETPSIEILAGGVSNRTVLVQRESGEAWVLKQALAKLRVQVDWFSPPERVHREADGLRWLAKLAPPGAITPLVFEDFQHHLIAMDAVPQPHANWKSMLMAGDLQMGHIEQFATMLASLETAAASCRNELLPVFADRGYFESLRLEPYYGYAAEQTPQARSFLLELMDETRAHNDTLVHGDYSPKNVLVYQDRLILLDHEVIHFGDPGFDLGFSLTHLLSKAHHMPAMRPRFADAARHFWCSYWNIVASEPWAGDLEPRAVRHTLACMLARVRGRSPLEYLDDRERANQAEAVIQVMAAPPERIDDLIEAILAQLVRRESQAHVSD